MLTKQAPIPFSVLDLAPVPQGATPSDAFHASLDLARHAEQWGYHRYWMAEHHNMTGIASAATSVLLGVHRQRHHYPARRLRRRHAAEPLAAGDCRAVWHAGYPLPRTGGFGARPRARYRNLSTCAAAGRARCRRRWKISRRCGRRVSNTALIKLCGCR